MSVAKSYAKALYEAAAESASSPELLNQIEIQLNQFATAVQSSKECQIALLGQVANAREKIQIVEEIAKKMNVSEILKQFLLLLAKKDRLNLIDSIRDAFSAVRLEMEGGLSCSLVSADPISASDIDTLAKAFGKKLGKKVAFRVSTDASLLAGIKVTVNGVTYDGTLRSQLQKLRDRFVAGLPGAHA